MGLPPRAAVAHEARLLEHAQVLGCGGLGDTGMVGQRMDRLLALAAQPLEDGAAGGIGQRSEHEIGRGGHADSITAWLLITHNPSVMASSTLSKAMRQRPACRMPGMRETLCRKRAKPPTLPALRAHP